MNFSVAYTDKNGVYLRKSDISFEKIHLKNEEIGGSSKTRVIFKYGYEIEDKFRYLFFFEFIFINFAEYVFFKYLSLFSNNCV